MVQIQSRRGLVTAGIAGLAAVIVWLWICAPTTWATSNEIQKVRVQATAGAFTLRFERKETTELPYKATAEEVQSALEALSSVGAGNVAVTGGPGDETGTHPYFVTFIGTLGNKVVETMKQGGSGELQGGAHTVSISVAPGAPAWSIHTVAMPTYISPLTGGNVVLLVTNHGAQPTDGQAVVVQDTLPEGLTVTEATGEEKPHQNALECVHTETTVTCTYQGTLPGENTDGLSIAIGVAASGSPTGPLMNAATVSGGGAVETSTSSLLTISAGTPLFGLASFDFGVSDAQGEADTQAGDHPNAVSVGFDLSSVPSPENAVFQRPVQPLKSATVELPLGLIGDPRAAPTCPQYELALNKGGINCPAASVIGSVAYSGEVAGYALSSPQGTEISEISPLFNVQPEHGYPAEFAFVYNNNTAFMYASIAHTSAGYVVRTTVPAIPLVATIKSARLTFFGDPAGQDGGAISPTAFFTNPVDCSSSTGQLAATIKADSWSQPERVVESSVPLPPVTGCNRLQFDPTLAVAPQTTQVDSPTGITVDLKMPQNEEPGTLATPELRDATVTLPEGMSVSPPSAGGLRGCPPTGTEGINLYEEREGVDGQQHLVPGHCPDASQIGEVKITTPLLASPLEGHVYLAQPGCGPCTETDAEEGRMIGLYFEVEGSGVNIKLQGTVEVGGDGIYSQRNGLRPGQLRTKFLNNPQQPVSDIEVTLKGGPFAPLANSQICGEARTTSVLTPWSAPETPAATPSSYFTVDADGAGGACAANLPFAPGFSAGSVTPVAGAFSPFTLTLSRSDGQQDLGGIRAQIPTGLLGKIAGVPRCPEPQASEGTCSQESLVGHTTAGAGPGSHPFFVPGNVFLTGPYKGAPFGLSIVTRAVAGPFDLGDVVVRAAIFIDPHTATLTVIGDPLPLSRDGVPLRLETVNVTIDRAGFMFNPTSCAQQAVNATIEGALPGGGHGSSVPVSSPFAVAGCANLPLSPSFTVSTQAKTSKANGASLDVKLAQRSGEADIRKVDVTLPSVLPARLTTLQKACTEAQFAANPAACPAASDVGIAIARTPVLDAPLTGPAYLVSHGGAAFPDLVILLQGEGVAIELIGNTDIKKGITFSRFESVPDAPIDIFELSLPEGSHSVLTANGSLCTRTLLMPTTITGQNGRVFDQSTRIGVKDCPNAIVVLSHSVHGHTVDVSVVVPAAGRLTASSRRFGRVSKTSHGRETLKLKLTRHGHGTAASRRIKVNLSFTPKVGRSISKTISIHSNIGR